MKTAMKNLIEKIAYENEFGTWMTGLVEDSNISDMVEKALKEERQQIEDAYNQGYREGEAMDGLGKDRGDISEFSGEQLAREIIKIKYKGYSHAKYEESLEMESYQQGFIDSHNLQEVKIASLRADLEKANKLFNSIKIPFDVDEMRSNYDRMAEENGQMLVNCANWKRELAAKDAENEALKKEVENWARMRSRITMRIIRGSKQP
jgi:regulator of replication initiation timing